MDFSVIRPKLPPKRPEPPTPKPPAAADTPPPPPPPHEKSPPPHPPPAMPHMGGPYMEEFDMISRMQRLRNIEYTHARTWRMNFGNHPNDYYDNSYNNYGYQQNHHQGGGNYNHHMYDGAGRPPPLPDQYHYSLTGPQQRLALPPPDHNHGPLRGPAPCHYLLPPPDYNYGPLRGPAPCHNLLPPPDHNYGPLGGRAPTPYYGGGYFSDENPNGCMIM